MSKKGGSSMDHILKKYPELMNNFAVMDTNGVSAKKDVGMGRLLRKHMARSKKLQVSKAVQNVKLKRSDNVKFGRVKSEKLFACPICRNVLETPVTVVCGHTFCKECLTQGNNGKCFECDTDIGGFKSINILVQDIVDKWKEHHRADGDVTCIKSRLDPEPRYCLRSRCNGHHDVQLKNHNILREKNRNRDAGRVPVGETSWEDITSTDLECILCSQCLLDPVTTTCGHTFCRECLARVLDHGLACPLCMAPLKNAEQYRGETVVLTQALKILAVEEHHERLIINQDVLDNLEKNSQVPIFICTNAFPQVACPLFVYEPRYRLLSRRCMQSTRKRFGMAAKTNDKFALYGTILEIKDCVNLQDGTSILTTIGLRRFKVLSRGEQDGYDTAVVQYIRDNIVSVEKLPGLIELHQRVHSKTIRWLETLKWGLLAEIERCIGCMPTIEKDWLNLPDGPSWTWWLIAVLPLSLQLRVGFLSSTSLEKRLLAIEKMLDHLKIRMEAVERNTLNCSDAEEPSESCSFSERSVDIPYQNEQ